MRQKTVLIVDDEADFADMIQMRLEANSYKVIVANDGQSGIEKAEADMPDAILLDVMMPGMDGFKVLHELKSRESVRDIPVIMLTAKGESKSILRAQQSGAVDYLIKPVDSEKMVEMLRRYV
jgi:DNA-binding response OmpR family regulator